MGQSPSNSDEKPEPGDLIEIFRGPYEHWGVYVGDGYVVHFTLSCMVKKEKLGDVVGTDRWNINNRLDERYGPRSVQVIVREALAKVGEVLPYNLLKANCEHFANELRYGISESRQVQVGETVLVAGGAATGVLGGVGSVAFGALRLS